MHIIQDCFLHAACIADIQVRVPAQRIGVKRLFHGALAASWAQAIAARLLMRFQIKQRLLGMIGHE